MTRRIASFTKFARAVLTEFKSGVRLRDLGVFLVAVHNPSTGQVIRGHFHCDRIADKHTNVAHTHLSTKMSKTTDRATTFIK